MSSTTRRSFLGATLSLTTLVAATLRTAATRAATSGGPGASTPRTPEEVTAGVTPTDLRYPPLNVRRYGAALDARWNGTVASGTDDTAAFERAVQVAAVNGGTVTFDGPACVRNVRLKAKVSVQGVGKPTAYLVPASSQDTAFKAVGVAGTAVPLAADAKAGDTTISVGDAHGFAAGQWVLLSTNEFILAPSGQKQQLCLVKAVAGNGLTVANALFDDFAVQNSAQVAPFAAPVTGIVLSGFQIQVPKGDDGGGINLTRVTDFRIHDVSIAGAAAFPAIRCITSAFGEIDNNTVSACQNTKAGGSAGLALDLIESSHDIKVHDNVMSEYTEIEFGMRVHRIQFTHNNLSRMADSGVNTHGNLNGDILIANNTISDSQATGIAIGYSIDRAYDHDITVSGNKITNCGGKAISISSRPGQLHQRIHLINNEIRGVKRTYTATTQAILAAYVNDLEVRGNTIDGTTVGKAPDAGLSIQNSTKVVAQKNTISNFASGYGVELVNTADYDVGFNTLTNNQNHCNTVGSRGSAWIHDNKATTRTKSIEAGAVRSSGNTWD